MAKKFYAVQQGRVPGVYRSWEECKAQVHGYSGAVYKSFSTAEEAMRYVTGQEVKESASDLMEGSAVGDGSSLGLLKGSIGRDGSALDLLERNAGGDDSSLDLLKGSIGRDGSALDLLERNAGGDDSSQDLMEGSAGGDDSTLDLMAGSASGNDSREQQKMLGGKNADCQIIWDQTGNDGGAKNPLVAYVDGSYYSATGEFSYGVVILQNGSEYCFYEKMSDPELAAMHNVAGEIKGAEAAMRYAVEHGYSKITIYHDYEGIARWCTGDWKANKSGTQAYKAYYDSISDRLQVRFEKVKGHSGDKYNDMADRLAKQALGLIDGGI